MNYSYKLDTKWIQNLPIFGSFKAIVVGAGPAGVATATVLGEKGHKTLIIEKYGFCGGATVAGLSGTICGLFNSTNYTIDKKPEQIVFGFADRFYQDLRKRGGITKPQVYGNTWLVTHELREWKKVAVSFLNQDNIDILFHTQFVGSIVKDGIFKGVVINTKSGFAKVLGDYIVDASGDGDVIFRSGLKTTMGKNGVIQNPTSIFRLGNVDIEKFKAYWGKDTISPKKVINLLLKEDKLPRKKVWIFPTVRDGELMLNATKIEGYNKRALNATNPIDHTEAELVALDQQDYFYEFAKKHIKGCENSYILDTSLEVGIRQTRTIDGIGKLLNNDVLEAKKQKSAISKSAWPMELHVKDKPQVTWLFDDYYEIPYESLLPKQGENIIVAGRCLCAEHEALASARVTAQCFMYGQAAATAIDIAQKTNKSLKNIDTAILKDELNKDNARL